MRPANEIATDDPLALFDEWLREAEEREINDPTATALATATPDGRPSVRMVLAKRVGPHRFAFFTNAESRKGQELAVNPHAALCFHWKSLRRQVRVEGRVVPLADAEVDRYFHSRSRDSQTGAAVSQQSRPLASREELIAQVEEFAAANPGEVPRPGYWRGFSLDPVQIEFWIDGAHRLHDRFLFTREDNGWRRSRLYP
ncbi:pyridoxamine 5'-phosphate oxidase [Acidobacteria bacterium AB60]|nr:pyridoxamine 5'-phosphate oxidase [Acidobacteria bacterium AB60]